MVRLRLYLPRYIKLVLSNLKNLLQRQTSLVPNQEILIPGPVGNLEAIIQGPQDLATQRISIICHPHPLFQGTMDNKVVTTVARAFEAKNIPSIRFNFRGVGASAGSFGNITGEVDDCIAVVTWAQQRWPQAALYIAGFSF